MGKSMVSGEDFPLNQSIEHSYPFCHILPYGFPDDFLRFCQSCLWLLEGAIILSLNLHLLVMCKVGSHMPGITAKCQYGIAGREEVNRAIPSSRSAQAGVWMGKPLPFQVSRTKWRRYHAKSHETTWNNKSFPVNISHESTGWTLLFSLGDSCFEVPVPVENSLARPATGWVANHHRKWIFPISQEFLRSSVRRIIIVMDYICVFPTPLVNFFWLPWYISTFLCPSCHLPTSLICRKLAPDGAENKDAKPSCMRSRVTLENALLKTNSEHYWKLPSVSFPGASRVKPFSFRNLVSGGSM